MFKTLIKFFLSYFFYTNRHCEAVLKRAEATSPDVVRPLHKAKTTMRLVFRLRPQELAKGSVRREVLLAMTILLILSVARPLAEALDYNAGSKGSVSGEA